MKDDFVVEKGLAWVKPQKMQISEIVALIEQLRDEAYKEGYEKCKSESIVNEVEK